MNEVINSILDAEAKANEIIATANEKAKQIVIDADEQAEVIREKAITSFKSHRFNSITQAETKAKKQYDFKIQQGKEEGEILIKDSSSKINEIVDDVVRRIVE